MTFNLIPSVDVSEIFKEFDTSYEDYDYFDAPFDVLYINFNCSLPHIESMKIDLSYLHTDDDYEAQCARCLQNQIDLAEYFHSQGYDSILIRCDC